MTISTTRCFYRWLDANPDEQQRLLSHTQQQCPATFSQLNRLIAQHNAPLLTQLIENQSKHLITSDNWYELEGTTIDKYRLITLCGQGGMGAIFLAERADKLFKQKVAIKFYHAYLSEISSPEFLLKEAQLMANLNHSSIPKVYDAGLYNSSVYLVMEYIEGETLDNYLAHTTLSIKQKYHLCLEICRAVEHAHQYCLLHADLKPQNILITKDGKPKILDFNIVQPSFTQSSPATMMLNSYSLGFSSPEQQQGLPLSVQSDVYSLGKIIGHIFPPSSFNYELNVVHAVACHDDVSMRYQSVSELIQDLENLANKKPISQLQNHFFYCLRKSFERYRIRWLLSCALVMTLTGFSVVLADKNQFLRHEVTARELLVKELANLLYVSRTTLQSDRDMASVVHNVHEFVLRKSDLPTDVKTRLTYALMLPISDKYSLNKDKTTQVPYRRQ